MTVCADPSWVRAAVAQQRIAAAGQLARPAYVCTLLWEAMATRGTSAAAGGASTEGSSGMSIYEFRQDVQVKALGAGLGVLMKARMHRDRALRRRGRYGMLP